MILVINYLGGQFALFATTPQSAAPLRSAASLRGNRCYRGRRPELIEGLFSKLNLLLHYES